MSKTFGIVALFGVALLAIGGAWWALSGETGTPAATNSADPRVGTREAPAPTPAGDPAPRTPRAGAARAGSGDAASLAVAGVVTDSAGKPLAGARVECFRIADGEPGERMRLARELLSEVVGDDAEMEQLAAELGTQLGVEDDEDEDEAGSGGNAPPAPAVAPDGATQRRALRSGRRMFGRIATDPSIASRLASSGLAAGAGFERDMPFPSVGTTTTGPDGAFRFEDLATGRLELRVTAPKHQRRKMRVKAGDTAISVRLETAGEVAGIVMCEGNPVPGAEVRARTSSVRTGGDGRFHIDGCRPPREPLMVSAKGCVTNAAWASVVPGMAADEVTITLEPAGSIRGRVTTRDGAPVAGASISLPADLASLMQLGMRGQGANSLPAPAPSATTAADGTYVLEGVPARTLKVRADAKGLLGATSAPVVVTAHQVSDDVNFVLTRESVFEGHVTDASGTPIEGADVRVEVPAEGMMAMAAAFMGGTTRDASTAADGAYRVNGLAAGSRGVTVEADGYLREKVTVEFAEETVTRREFALRPGYVLRGRVVKPDGTPGVRASVRVKARGSSNSALPILEMFGGESGDSVLAGDDGAFEVKGLQEGPWTVTASLEGWIDGTANGVEPGSEPVLTLGAAATIRGRVVGPDGSGVADARVIRRGKGAKRATGNAMLDQFMPDPDVRTAADGTFSIAGLAAGTWELQAKARGFADSGRTKIEAAAGAVLEGIEIVLPAGASVSGRVVRKSDGAPLADVVVWVATETSGLPFAGFAGGMSDAVEAPTDSVSAKSGPDGSFVLEGLTPGKVTVEARAAGFAPRSVGSAEVPSSSVVIEMSAGGSVEGVVFGANGRPADGATVMLQSGMMGRGFMRTVTTGRDGTYRIERVPAGSYSAMLLDPEKPMGLGGMSPVTVRDGEVTTKDFGKRAAGAPVKGTVTADGVPMKSATVMLVGGPGGIAVAQANERGEFQFDQVEPGEYSVAVQTAESLGGTPAGRVTVTAGGTVPPLDLRISSLVLTGVVTDGDTGAPVGFAQVTLLEPGGAGTTLADMMARQKGQAFTSASGEFRMGSVPAGSYTLRVAAAGFAETEIRGVSAGGAPVRVKLSRGVEFAVTVVGAVATAQGFEDRPVSGATVVPTASGGDEGSAFDITMSKITGDDGVARLRLQPGVWTLRIRAAGHPETSISVDAASGAATVRLEAGGVLDVVVRSGGTPVVGASVRVLDGRGNAVEEAVTMTNFLTAGATTDADGRVRREGLRAGPVTVVVRTPAGKESRATATIAAGRTTTVEIAAE